MLGGARSGKSALAEARAATEPVRYLATGRHDAADDDWERRIEEHRLSRPSHWTTVESDASLASAIAEPWAGTTLVDDLGTWLTGVLDDAHAWDRPRGTVASTVDELVSAVADCTCEIVLVSPEVGLSVVPETRSGRLFRDELGLLNSRLAAVCDEVLLVVAGLPLTLKGPKVHFPNVKGPL